MNITQSPRVRLYLDSLIALSHRHGVVMSHDQDPGGLSVVPIDRDAVSFLDEATDFAGAGAPITAAIAASLGNDGLPTQLRHAADHVKPDIRDALMAGALTIERLRRGLAQAISELEGAHMAQHGYPPTSPELDALKALLPAGTPT